jgi:hypothetical protein
MSKRDQVTKIGDKLVVQMDAPSHEVTVVFEDDGARAGLRVNASLWALFDFDAQSGWSRSNFPPPAGRWRMGEARPDWSDALVKLL